MKKGTGQPSGLNSPLLSAARLRQIGPVAQSVAVSLPPLSAAALPESSPTSAATMVSTATTTSTAVAASGAALASAEASVITVTRTSPASVAASDELGGHPRQRLEHQGFRSRGHQDCDRYDIICSGVRGGVVPTSVPWASDGRLWTSAPPSSFAGPASVEGSGVRAAISGKGNGVCRRA